jgi:carboxylate-amine ligase
VPFDDLLDELLDLVAEDADALECEAEIEHVRTIVARGTSAHRQINVFEESKAFGANTEDALKNVVDTLIEDTAEGL